MDIGAIDTKGGIGWGKFGEDATGGEFGQERKGGKPCKVEEHKGGKDGSKDGKKGTKQGMAKGKDKTTVQGYCSYCNLWGPPAGGLPEATSQRSNDDGGAAGWDQRVGR